MKLGMLAATVCLLTPLTTQALVSFQSGQIAKAEDFNTNFTELNDRLTTVEGSNPYVTATVNGVEMKVRNFNTGYYSIITPTGVTVTVDEQGYPVNSTFYFASSDCSGVAYVKESSLDEKMSVGGSYTNPNILQKIEVTYDGTNSYYTNAKTFVKLNYNSTWHASTGQCSSYSGTTIAQTAIANDPAVTGIDSFPLIITGIGSPITISGEVGDPVTGEAMWGSPVYANGVKIGMLTYLPYGADGYIQVRLDAYPDQTVSLYKDGSYYGLSFGNAATIYYLSSDCSGSGYVKVLNDNNQEWWSGSKTMSGPIYNNGNYYELSAEIYRTTSGFQGSRSSSSTVCSAVTSTTVEDGYKKATLTTQPNIPVFTPPITVEGWSEETNINTLPEATP